MAVRVLKIPRLELRGTGATRDHVKRGLAAARARFKAADVTVEQAFKAYDKREGWEAGEAEPTDQEWAIAHLWEDAQVAALKARCGDATQAPAGACLVYRTRYLADLRRHDTWFRKSFGLPDYRIVPSP